MADVNIPKISFPFRLDATGRKAVVVEQDFDDEIIDCVWVLLSTSPGERLDEPSYGLPDQAFSENGANLQQVNAIVREWEPRAQTAISRVDLSDLTDRVRINVMEQNG